MDEKTRALLREQINKADVQIAEAKLALERLKTLRDLLERKLDGTDSLIEMLEANGLSALALYAKEDRNGRS